jgi:hypothetical protein
LYLYSIKIQTDIDKNAVKKLRKITDFLKGFFGILKKKFYWTRPGPKGTGLKSAQNKTGLLSTRLDSAQPHGLG